MWTETPRYGRQAGPGALVVLVMALALYHQRSPKERSMVVFAPPLDPGPDPRRL